MHYDEDRKRLESIKFLMRSTGKTFEHAHQTLFWEDLDIKKQSREDDDGFMKITDLCKRGFGRKIKPQETSFDFAKLVNITGTGRPELTEVAEFMSTQTGKDFENCFVELTMPRVEAYNFRNTMPPMLPGLF